MRQICRVVQSARVEMSAVNLLRTQIGVCRRSSERSREPHGLTLTLVADKFKTLNAS